MYDTNNNFASGTYTAPVAGFYMFNAGIQVSPGGASRECALELYKNGSSVLRFGDGTSTADFHMSGSGILQSAANDTWDVYAYGSAAVNLVVGANKYSWFNGFLVSRT